MAVRHGHDFGSFTTLGLPDFSAPFFAEAKLPSMNASRTLSRPRTSNPQRGLRTHLSKCRTAPIVGTFDGTFDRVGSSGRSAHGAPVRSTQSIPFSTARRSFHGRPRPSFRRDGSGM